MNFPNRIGRGAGAVRSAFWLGMLLLVSAFFAASGAVAQDAAEAVNIVKPLGEKASVLITRLTALNHMEAGEWRFHTGDLAHGEDPALDDSGWKQVKPRYESGPGAVWYRRWIEVPKNLNGYDLTGASLWFRFNADTDGVVNSIVYVNGKRMAMGWDLESIEMIANAKPGERVLVAVKLLRSETNQTFTGTDLRIEAAPSRPNPEDFRKSLLVAAELIPSLSKDPKSDLSTVDQAIAQVDLAALDAGDQTRFDASLRQASATLEKLRPLMAGAHMHLIGNSHIDAAWLWPWTETVDIVHRTFSTALQLLEEYPDYTYTQSAAVYSAWLADKYPSLNEEIKRRIKEGRWEIVGGMWVEPDLNLPDGEAQVRTILLGKRWFQQNYGVDVRIGWNPDSFGYTWQLPQIYKRSGIDYFVTQKTAWNDTNQFPFKLFWWESPDGSKVLTYFPNGYGNQDLNPVRLSADLADARKKTPGLNELMDLYGVGDHGGGPTRNMLDEGLHWMQPGRLAPKMQFGTAQSYFDSVEKKMITDPREWDYDSIARGYTPPAAPPEGKISVPTWKSEFYFEYHRGVMTTQAGIKRNMRDSEEQMLNSEKFAALAWLAGKPYPAETLTEAWKKVVFNDFHDLAAGSGIGVIYKEAQQDYDEVAHATGLIDRTALAVLAAETDTRVDGGAAVLVVNPLAWERTGTVTAEVQMPVAPGAGVSVLNSDGRVLPSATLVQDEKTHTYRLQFETGRVPSLGVKVLHVVAGAKPFTSDLKAEGLTLENSLVKVTIDGSTGCITSLYDKAGKFETLKAGSCGNQLEMFKDLPKDYDAWNIDYGTLDHFTALDKPEKVELVERGPLHAAIRISYNWQSSKLVQEIGLYAFSDEVNVSSDIDWHETHTLLKAAFTLAASAKKATYETPYGTIQRPTTRDNSWEKAQFEVPALRWADLSDGQHGFSLLNNSKYGYDTKDNVMRISLLRSPTWPDPVADRGHQHFTYALYPHAGDWQRALTVRRGYEYNYALRAQQVEPHAGRCQPRSLT